MLVVGIDVGGTHTKFGLVENGKIIRSMELGTNTFDVIRQICNGAREIVQTSNKAWEEVDGIAVGFPGMVIESVVLDSPNISLQNCNLKEILEKELGKFVVVRNDAEMATLAEHKVGAGADCDNMVLITLGTGVGGGIIANRKLYVGAGGAGELGHIIYERNGRNCTCGRRGCAEQYISMIALDKLAKDIMVRYPNTCVDFNGDGQIYASELMRAYKKNDDCAIEVVDRYVENITQYMLDLCNLFRPNRIVIGGGITHAPELIDMIARNCRRLEYGYKNSPKVDILAAQLGNQAGILGGYVCVEEELREKDVDEEYVNETEEENNEENKNMSLLDSISLRLDKQVTPTKEVGVDNSSFIEEESSGLYVNKVLDDISTEIDTIKNEQLLGDVESEEKDNYENVEKSIETDFGVNETVATPNYMDNDYDNNVNSLKNNGSISNVDLFSSITNENNASNDVFEKSLAENNVDMEYMVEDNDSQYNNTTEDYNNSLDNGELGDEEENVSLGLNDIFFGSNTDSSIDNDSNVAIENTDNLENSNNFKYSNELDNSNNIEQNNNENYDSFENSRTEENDTSYDEYDNDEDLSEEEMLESDVVYDNNLLSRVNAMLNKKNK